jgi:hypothetical protein
LIFCIVTFSHFAFLHCYIFAFLRSGCTHFSKYVPNVFTTYCYLDAFLYFFSNRTMFLVLIQT